MFHPGELLQPAGSPIPYVGGADWSAKYWFDSLIAWCAGDPAPFAIRAIHAPAGAGKTRFALELMARLKDKHPDWHGELVEFPHECGGPSLQIVDHAAGVMPRLRSFLENVSPASRLRVILLERFAETGRGWMYNLFGDPWIGDPHANQMPATVSKLDKRHWETLFRAAVDLYAARSGETVPEFDQPFRRTWAAADVLDDRKWNPGHLLLAAVAIFHESPAQVARLSAQAIARRLAEEHALDCGLARDAALDLRPEECEAAGLVRWLYALREYETAAIQEFVRRKLPPLSLEELETADGMLPHDRPALRDLAIDVALRLLSAIQESTAGLRGRRAGCTTCRGVCPIWNAGTIRSMPRGRPARWPGKWNRRTIAC